MGKTNPETLVAEINAVAKQRVLTQDSLSDLRTFTNPRKKEATIKKLEEQEAKAPAGKTFDRRGIPDNEITWKNITMILTDLSSFKVKVKVGSRRARTVTMEDLGFRDNRTKNALMPDMKWPLLWQLATTNSITLPDTGDNTLEKRMNVIRQRLKAFFGLDTDPIVFDHDTRKYRPVLAMVIGDIIPPVIEVPQGTLWEEIGIGLSEDGLSLLIDVPSQERKTYGNESTTAPGTRRTDRPLEGLALTKAQEMMLITFVDNGIVKADSDDKNALWIRTVLEKLIPGAEGEPVSYSFEDGQWRREFGSL